MLNSNRFDLLLKSYCRTSGFSRTQAAKFSKIEQERFTKLSSFPVHLPEITEVMKVIKYLKIPPDLVWQSYFNSIIKVFYIGEEVVLTPLDQYADMIRNNKSLRPAKQSIPSDEVWLDIEGKVEALLGFDLATFLKHSIDYGNENKPDPSDTRAVIKFLVDRLELKPEQVKFLLQKQIPGVDLLTHLVYRQPTYHQSRLLEAYLVSVIKKYKLNYKIELMSPGAYEQLLNQLYP